MNFIFIKSKRVLTKVLFSNILYVEANGDYCNVVTSTGKFLIHSTFKAILSKLPMIFQCNRSYAINIKNVKHIDGEFICMDDSSIIPIGEKYKSALLKKLTVIM